MFCSCRDDTTGSMWSIARPTNAHLPEGERQDNGADKVCERIVQEGVAGTPAALLDQIPDHRPARTVAKTSMWDASR